MSYFACIFPKKVVYLQQKYGKIMYQKPARTNQQSLFFTLEEQLNTKHPLYILANKINWEMFEERFKVLYSQDNGCPCVPIRRMVGLLILKHLRNISDENVVEQWQENVYYQYFCGEQELQVGAPCSSTELVEFRKRIGPEGVELILQESIRVNSDHDKDDTGFIDSTVQEKNVTFPTDAKLTKKVIERCKKLSEDLELPVRQSYKRVLKDLARDQRFRNHPRNKKKALRADKKVKTIAGRLLRELERNLNSRGLYELYAEDIALWWRVLTQRKSDKDKVYSIHEPEVQCISKGKEHKKYEFGNKVSVVRTTGGLIIGAMSFRNEYDGHTIDPALRQVERLTGRRLKVLAGDRGYRGQKMSGTTKVVIPDTPKASDSYYKRRKKHDLFCKRAGIEPVIGHLKSDHRLGRNFYKGVFGDDINIMLSAAAFNFKRAMRLLLRFFFGWICEINGHDEESGGNIAPRIEYSSSYSLEPVCLHLSRGRAF